MTEVKASAKQFSKFSDLHDDIKLNILSFVADAPFESLPQHYPKSALTHQLPFVCKKFRSFAQLDGFWKDAALRQLSKEPFLWKEALLRVCGDANTTTIGGSGNSLENSAVSLVERAFGALSSHHERSSYKLLYQTAVTNHLRFKGPVFFMPGNLQLGEPYGLHFFEPRYRLLISEVMQAQPTAARHGGRLAGELAYFVHANRTPLAPTTPAVLVRVLRCDLYPDGRADVVLLPTAHVWMERLWVRPRSGNLYYTQCLKMGRSVTAEMNILARQEALVHVMDRLATEFVDDLNNNDDEDDENEEEEVENMGDNDSLDEDVDDHENGFYPDYDAEESARQN